MKDLYENNFLSLFICTKNIIKGFKINRIEVWRDDLRTSQIHFFRSSDNVGCAS